MKILHLISGGDKGGAKTHVFILLQALMEDIDINIICFMDGVFYKEIQKMPVPSMLFKQKYRNDLSVVKKLVHHIREENYDIIHSHGARANFISVFLKRYIKLPIITSVHSDYKLDFTTSLYKKLIFTQLNTKSLKFFDYYIAVSENFKDMLVSRNFNKDKIYTVYNAIDFDNPISYVPKEDYLSSLNIDYKNKIIVGIIGRFDKVKGHEVFIKSAFEVLKKNKYILFLLAGEGAEQNNLMNLAKSLGISENIIFIGFVDNIYNFINAIDINTLTSHSESFPYVLLEGSIFAKPTVSTNVGGISDLIKHMETGLLSEPNNPKDFAEKLLMFIENPTFMNKMGKNLFEFSKSNFSKEKLKNRHIEIYNDIIERQKSNNKLFDIMLSGYYGFNNSGDDALLGSIIKTLKEEQPDLSIIVLSKNPKETQILYGVYSINRSLKNFMEIIDNLKRSKVFLNGGGSLIQDITSTKSLLYYTLLISWAKKYGLKVMLYANGIGPINKKLNEKRAINALNLCDIITLRDAESFNEMTRLGLDTNDVLLSADPAFVMESINEVELKEILIFEKIDINKKYFVVSVRQWKNSDINFASNISLVINKVYENKGLIPLFIPMQYPYDEIISKEIIGKLAVPYVILSKSYNVMQLMGIISQVEFVLGMRLHTLIYAVRMGVPVIGIVYDPKIKAFMDYINQKYYVDCSLINTIELYEIIELVYNKTSLIKEEIRLKFKIFEELSVNDAKLAISLLNKKELK